MSEVKTTPAPRPLSPHIGIYRWKLHMLLSILHRVTGCALGFFLPVLVFWLWAVAYSPECFTKSVTFFKTGPGELMLLGWTFAFYLHFANGIRHLFWDMGKGFDIKTSYKTGVIAVIFAVILALFTWSKAVSTASQPEGKTPSSTEKVQEKNNEQ